MELGTKRAAQAGLACISLLLAGCSDIKVKDVWPFGDDNAASDRARAPANATEYQCAGGKRFYLRTRDDGGSVWLILPERELRLDKLGDGTRYSKGNTVLQLNGKEATLSDGASAPFTGCKAAAGG